MRKVVIKAILSITHVIMLTSVMSSANAKVSVKKFTLENDGSVSCSTGGKKFSDVKPSGVIFTSKNLSTRSSIEFTLIDASDNIVGTFKSKSTEYVAEKNFKFTGELTMNETTYSATLDVYLSSLSEGSASISAKLADEESTTKCTIYVQGEVANENFNLQ